MLWKIPFFALFAIEVLTFKKVMTEEEKKKFEETLKKYCKANDAENVTDDTLNYNKTKPPPAALRTTTPNNTDSENTTTVSTRSRRRSTTISREPDKDPMGKYTMTEKQRKKFRAAMKRYCMQNGGDDRDADEVEHAMRNLIKCARNIVEPKKLKREMDVAWPFGKKMMQKVFGKYCERTYGFKECVFGMTKKAVNCMTENTRYQLDGYNGIVDVVINFWCYKGAERLGVFFTSAGGPRCIENTFNYLVDCTISIKKRTVFWENCDTFQEFAACIVRELLACSKREVSLLAGKLLKEIYTASPCRDETFKLK